ncbi:MAG: hypothetical protein L0I24_01060 [Pseudonocardia sp.]|nr:hypothetical protein [Pseudonocardia sp.]
MSAPDPVVGEVEVLAYAAIEREAKRRKELGKAIIGQRYPDGRTERIRSPLGDRMGSVYRTDPEPQWVVTDREALHAHLRTFPGNLTISVGIAPEDMAEALAVLDEFAAHLLTETTVLDPEAERAALAQSAATGEPAAPGIERVKPSGSLTVSPAKDAFDVVGRLMTRGLLSWDGRPSLPSSEEGAA